MKKLKPSKYIPAGPAANVQARPIRNAKIAQNVAVMYGKWFAEQFPSRVRKPDTQPSSISSLKIAHRCKRAVARAIQAQLFGEIHDSNQASV